MPLEDHVETTCPLGQLTLKSIPVPPFTFTNQVTASEGAERDRHVSIMGFSPNGNEYQEWATRLTLSRYLLFGK